MFVSFVIKFKLCQDPVILATLIALVLRQASDDLSTR
jgi:hypothetical protein